MKINHGIFFLKYVYKLKFVDEKFLNILMLTVMTCITFYDKSWITYLKLFYYFDFSFKNKIEIEVGGQNVYTDSVHLHNVPGLTMKKSMKNYKVRY